MRRRFFEALALTLALLLAADEAFAVTARWTRHWRKRSHAPALPFPELLHPRDTPLLPSGFVMTVMKRVDRDAGPQSVARPRDVAERLAACWSPPAAREAQEITLRLQFTASGAVRGEPRITYVKPASGEGARQSLVASIKAALADCAPLRFTGSLGPAIAGYPFAIRFIAAGQNP